MWGEARTDIPGKNILRVRVRLGLGHIFRLEDGKVAPGYGWGRVRLGL